MKTPIRFGKPIRVNTTTQGEQRFPAIAGLAGGGFLIVWTSGEDYPPNLEVKAQKLTADGLLAGKEFLVARANTFSYLLEITDLASGRFVITWVNKTEDDRDSIFTGLLDTSGKFLYSTINVNDAAFTNEIRAVALADRGWIIARDVIPRSDLGFVRISAIIFNSDGSQLGNEFFLGASNSSAQYEPRIAALNDGRFIAAWRDSQRIQTSFGFRSIDTARAQVFNRDGTAAGPGFVMVPSTSMFRYTPKVTVLNNGLIAATWTDYGSRVEDTTYSYIRAQIFTINGEKVGAEIPVITTSLGGPSNNLMESPEIASLPDGRFVIAWTDYSNPAPDFAERVVRAQVFNANGSKAGGSFFVNTVNTGIHELQKITTLTDGRFVVTWVNESVYNKNILAQIFDPRIAAVNLLAPYGIDSDYVGTIFNDTMLGADGNDRFQGAQGDDDLSGYDGVDKLSGGAGNDSLDGDYGNDYLYGGSGNDSLDGDNGNDRLDGESGNDSLNGGSGDDNIYGGFGNDSLKGGIGEDFLNGEDDDDLLDGGAGNDSYFIDTLADRILELPNGGRDSVLSDVISIDLSRPALANVENAGLSGSAPLALIGSATNNRLVGNSGSNTLTGRGGADTLIGLDGKDIFVLDDSTQVDTITDFRSGTDKVLIRQSGIPIGNGSILIDQPVSRNAPSGFANGCELVIFSSNISGSITNVKAAATIGTAKSPYAIGSRRIFVVDNGISSALFLFSAANSDSRVAASELTQLATLSTTPALALADLVFMA